MRQMSCGWSELSVLVSTGKYSAVTGSTKLKDKPPWYAKCVAEYKIILIKFKGRHTVFSQNLSLNSYSQFVFTIRQFKKKN